MNNSRSMLPRNLKHYLLLGVSSLFLTACGGGGGGGSDDGAPLPPSSEQNQDFSPNSERLLEQATESKELYVEEDFNFDHSLLTRLSIRLTDESGNPVPFSRLNIYVVDTTDLAEIPEEWVDDLAENAQLLTGGMSNSNGDFVRLVELPKQRGDSPLLLIEANTVGNENKQLVRVDSANTQVSLGAI